MALGFDIDMTGKYWIHFRHSGAEFSQSRVDPNMKRAK